MVDFASQVLLGLEIKIHEETAFWGKLEITVLQMLMLVLALTVK